MILFSHPADFTPVCTTEFMTFATMIDEFKALNTELIGLSVDSIYSHIAWLRKIQEIEYKGMKNVEVTFPLIEDIKMEVANKYGMIQPGQSNTQAVRAVFVIDPKGKIRTILYYPLDHRAEFRRDQADHTGAAEGRRGQCGHPCRLAARGRCDRAHGGFLRDREGEDGEPGRRHLLPGLVHVLQKRKIEYPHKPIQGAAPPPPPYI